MTSEQRAAIVALIRAGEPIPPELARVLWATWSRNLRELHSISNTLWHWGHLPAEGDPYTGLADIVAELAERDGMVKP